MDKKKRQVNLQSIVRIGVKGKIAATSRTARVTKGTAKKASVKRLMMRNKAQRPF